MSKRESQDSGEVFAKQPRLSSCMAAPFADPDGIKTGDYNPVSKEDADKIDRPIRVYADGIYDLFHAGHARQLKQCKELFKNVHLLVGVCSDELTHKKKGKTVNNEWERYENVSHCRYVDEVVKDAPWTLDEEFLRKHRIDFVAHDEDPYTIGAGDDAPDDIYAWIKKSGRFCATRRTDGVSTSDLITRVIKNYDHYIRRQLNRGINRRDLKVSALKATQLKADMKIDQIKGSIKEKFDEVKERSVEVWHEWQEKRDQFFRTFLAAYGNHNNRFIQNHGMSSDEEGPENQ